MARPVVKKAQIESAAVALFATRGLARTTIRQIAERAGVAEGTLYRHWPGKDEMAWQLYRREVERFSARLEAVLAGEGPALAERLAAGVRFIYRYYDAHPVEFSFILLTQHGFPGETIPDPHRNPYDIVTRFVAAAMERGELPAGDAGLAAALLMGVVLQPVVMHRYGRLTRPPIELAEEVAAAALAAIGAGRGEGASI